MTFTELEYVLMIAVAVLLWRNSSLHSRVMHARNEADRYANFLIDVGKGKGSVVMNDEGTWTYKPKEK